MKIKLSPDSAKLRWIVGLTQGDICDVSANHSISKMSHGFNKVHIEGRALAYHLFKQLPCECNGQNRFRVFYMQKRFSKAHFLLKAMLILNTI